MRALQLFCIWIGCGLCMAIPPLGVVVVVVFLIAKCFSSGNGENGHSGYSSCRSFGHEGTGYAKSYRDKRGRIKYCSNPNHSHFY